jgi:hypothetical protein
MIEKNAKWFWTILKKYKEIILITEEQVNNFAGNMLEYVVKTIKIFSDEQCPHQSQNQTNRAVRETRYNS